jgi:hypothetical protein
MYTRQELLRITNEMNKEWGIFDLIYYWQKSESMDMYKTLYKMSQRDVLWVMEHCFQEINEKQYDDKVLIRLHRNAYAVLAERVKTK